MADTPFVGPTHSLQSRTTSTQRTVNLAPVRVQPGNERAGWVFKDTMGLTLVDTTIVIPPPPPPPPMWLLHFDGNLTDSASGVLFEADTITSDAAPNSFTYTTDTPQFGTVAGRFPGTNNHIRSETWDDLQLASFDWQIEGFIRPRDVASEIGGPIICTGSLQSPNGAVVGPDPTSGQFALNVNDLGSGQFILEYSTALGSDEVTVVGTPAAVPVDVWTHWAIVSDATSLRLYAGLVSAGVSVKVAETLGVRPFAGTYDALQRFFIGATYNGGVPPLEVYTDRFHGDMDEMRMLPYVTYTEATINVPLFPFSAT